MKAAIYTRVSTDIQAEVEFNSCEAQELKIKSFIASQEKMEIFKVYSDQGYSGASLERPALKEMLNDIQQGKVDIVISYKIDRLTRSPKDFYQLIEIFDKNNVSFLSITERFDTSTPSGRLLRNIMLTFAQFERELISERIRDKIIEKAKKGLWCNGRPPFGYVRDDRKLVIEPKDAAIVRKMFETYADSPSVAEVYNKLKSDGVKNRSGLPFTKTSIDAMLKNVFYAGKTKHKENVYHGVHEPIVSPELFEEIRKLRSTVPEKKMTSYNYSYFPGIVRCKECGSFMTAVFTNKIKNGRRMRYFYYRCSSIVKRDRSFCSIKQVSADRLDKYIIENLDKIRKNKQYLDSLIYVLNHNGEGVADGIALNGSSSPIEAERLQEILKSIVDASKLKGKTEKRIIMKRHIEKVIYSKETIEVKILYSESGEAAYGPQSDPSAEGNDRSANNKAACRDASAAPSRPTSAMVRCESKLGARGVEPLTSSV